MKNPLPKGRGVEKSIVGIDFQQVRKSEKENTIQRKEKYGTEEIYHL